MKSKWILTLLLVVSGTATWCLQPPFVTAQGGPKPTGDAGQIAAPSFSNATIEEVLTWGTRNAGMTWMAGPGVMNGADGKPLRVSSQGGALLDTRQRTVLVYELLRSVGLVAMPVKGMPAGTVMVYQAAEAATVGSVETDIAGLAGTYFGTLALEAWNIPLAELEALARKHASPHAVISPFPTTSRVVIADFVDCLSTVWHASMQAQTPAERDDDVVTEFARSAKHAARPLAMALQGAVHAGEDAKVTLHEGSGAIMVTGRRIDVYRALDRFDALEELEALPASTQGINIYQCRILTPDVLAPAVRGAFAAEVATGSVRVAEVVSRGTLVVESTAAQWRQIEAIIGKLDVPARSVGEAERDEAWRAQKEAERRAAAAKSAPKDTPKENAPPAEKPADRSPAAAGAGS